MMTELQRYALATPKERASGTSEDMERRRQVDGRWSVILSVNK
jgi:hypothetical protein